MTYCLTGARQTVAKWNTEPLYQLRIGQASPLLSMLPWAWGGFWTPSSQVVVSSQGRDLGVLGSPFPRLTSCFFLIGTFSGPTALLLAVCTLVLVQRLLLFPDPLPSSPAFPHSCGQDLTEVSIPCLFSCLFPFHPPLFSSLLLSLPSFPYYDRHFLPLEITLSTTYPAILLTPEVSF